MLPFFFSSAFFPPKQKKMKGFFQGSPVGFLFTPLSLQEWARARLFLQGRARFIEEEQEGSG